MAGLFSQDTKLTKENPYSPPTWGSKVGELNQVFGAIIAIGGTLQIDLLFKQRLIKF